MKTYFIKHANLTTEGELAFMTGGTQANYFGFFVTGAHMCKEVKAITDDFCEWLDGYGIAYERKGTRKAGQSAEGYLDYRYSHWVLVTESKYSDDDLVDTYQEWEEQYKAVITLSTIGTLLTKREIHMADTAIRQGIISLKKANAENKIQVAHREAGEPYDFSLCHALMSGVDASSIILCAMFYCMGVECKDILTVMAGTSDGITGDAPAYLKDFILSLAAVTGKEVRLRVKHTI